MLRYIDRDSLDIAKWNNCVQQHENGLIYSRSDYLDVMTDASWKAIVYNDYECVMAVPFRRKYGVTYTYQPAFIQQLGVIGSEISQMEISAFAEFLYTQVKYISYPLNFRNVHFPSFHIPEIRINYLLPLHTSFKNIEENFSTDLKRRIRRSHHFNLVYQASSEIETLLRDFRKLHKGATNNYTAKDWSSFLKICNIYHTKNNLIIRVIMQNGNILAGCILFKDEKRLYNLVSVLHPEGRKTEANYRLYAEIIQEFSSSNLIFDFEGSDVNDIAHFYRKFGPQQEEYAFIQANNLRFPLNLFKR